MSRALKAIALLALIASFGVWVYAYGFVEESTPDLWDDPALATQAEQICAATAQEIGALPGALEAADGTERSEQILTSTAKLEAMVEQLAALSPTSTNDKTMHEGWITDWQTVLADRYRYAEAIATDPTAQYLQTSTGVERLDKRLTRFADTNKMYSCGAPTDV